MKTHLLVAFSAAVLGCAADPGTRPQDMSAQGHETKAREDEFVAASHEQASEGTTARSVPRCNRGGCWTSARNPTKEHQADADRHRELAAKHRAASSALTQAEARACVDVPEADRDMSPFRHVEDIQSVSLLEEEIRLSKGTTSKTVGARVVFRALPGMTAEWLQRVVDCHLARNAAAGFEMSEMDYCPLGVKGASAKVRSTGDGFAIEIKGDDTASTNEIIRRANALLKPKG